MGYTADNVTSAIEKLGNLELTDPEIEALTALLAGTATLGDEVAGYSWGVGRGVTVLDSMIGRGWKVEEGNNWKVEEGNNLTKPTTSKLLGDDIGSW